MRTYSKKKVRWIYQPSTTLIKLFKWIRYVRTILNEPAFVCVLLKLFSPCFYFTNQCLAILQWSFDPTQLYIHSIIGKSFKRFSKLSFLHPEMGNNSNDSILTSISNVCLNRIFGCTSPIYGKIYSSFRKWWNWKFNETRLIIFTDIAGGYLCFFVSIVGIGFVTAVIGDVASYFGCTLGIKDSVTAVVFVALGTSIPGEF